MDTQTIYIYLFDRENIHGNSLWHMGAYAPAIEKYISKFQKNQTQIWRAHLITVCVRTPSFMKN